MTNLLLSDNSLTGPIPPELGSLANLGALALTANDLSGPIPPELGNLANLQGLYLDSNSLSGSIPPELGGLSSLRWLYINGNPLSGPLPLELSALPLVLFHYYSTDICVPTDESFWTWLNAISDHRGTDVDCASGAPDLLVSSVVPTEITLVAGGSTETVTFTIHNAGDGEADSTTATIRASGDSTIATNDNQIGDTLAVPRLAASDSTRLAISFSAPAGLSPQVLYVGMCVERVSGESDADNNCSSAVEVTVVAGVTNLTNNSGKDSYPAWSPDGRSIAFTSNRDGNDDIHVMNADGTGVTRLTNSTFNYWSAWSPDGGRIAYGSSYGGGNYEIHVMNADGTGVTRLTNHSAWDDDPLVVPRRTPNRLCVRARWQRRNLRDERRRDRRDAPDEPRQPGRLPLMVPRRRPNRLHVRPRRQL